MRWLAVLLLSTQFLTAETFFLGTYSTNGSVGIYTYYFDPKTGNISSIGTPTPASSPSFLAINPIYSILYAVNEDKIGTVSSFGVSAGSRALKDLAQTSAVGKGPCHLAVDHTGKVLVIANYDSGSVVSYPLTPDGSIGAPGSVIQHQGNGLDLKRQAGPHAHSAYVSPDNKFVYVADLGVDRIYRYALDVATAKLKPTVPPYFKVAPGSGPRHIAFSKDNRFAYVVNELSSRVTVFRMDAKGGMTEVSSAATLPAGFSKENSTAEIELAPSGKFLYVSNRGMDSIAVFSVAAVGTLKLIQTIPTGGSTPRNFALSPNGEYLLAANQNSDNLSVFKVDTTSGKLTDTGKRTKVPSPVCILFLKN